MQAETPFIAAHAMKGVFMFKRFALDSCSNLHSQVKLDRGKLKNTSTLFRRLKSKAGT
ncbi:hypothetical protein [Noviherbaspirillum malthae]|uniref:hypothetical protein n=1 Tax=Noviherbaspirillum malthae TaxID=1260987 RepID=UPI00188FA447|nr:hypothetical protein [Noviherbaspirillum malthae]